MVLGVPSKFNEITEEMLQEVNGGSSSWFKSAALSFAAVAIFAATAPISAPVAAVVGVTAAHYAIVSTVIYVGTAAAGY